jgi:DNA-binding MarR family transcriptional regulator
MNSTDLECLDHILRGPITASRLAEVTGLTTGAITGVIDRLERVGLARRERDPDGRRKIMVRVLPAVGERIAPLFAPLKWLALQSCLIPVTALRQPDSRHLIATSWAKRRSLFVTAA